MSGELNDRTILPDDSVSAADITKLCDASWHPPDSRSRLTSGQLFDNRYRLLQQIGQGGMGEVWVADQVEGVQRRVAIKVIRHDFDSPQSTLRFEVERQTLAVLNHPNIAKVLDCGIERHPLPAPASGSAPELLPLGALGSRPYFVMDWIQGVSLTTFCDESRLTVDERVRLMIPVCQAVQHAHQKGIIHRDLKPSNILVTLADGVPVPKVIDFGVAKVEATRMAHDRPFTQIGTLVGTPEYMSPEQADPTNLDVDTRSDIYSLGVVLYELLTGEVPFKRSTMTMPEMMQAIKSADPLRPSQRISLSNQLPELAIERRCDSGKLSSLLKGELDWIVLRCLEKDRSQRYGSANELSADLSRYLAREPVSAHPPSWWYRSVKQFRRHRRMYLSAALLLLTLSVGIIGTTRGMWLARQESQRAAIAEGIAVRQARSLKTERDRAQVAEAEALRQANVARAVRDFLQNDLLGQANVNMQAQAVVADPGRPGRLKPDPTIRQLLDQVSRRFDEGPGDERLTADVQAELFRVIGNTYRGIGDYEQGIRFLQRSLKLHEQVYSMSDVRTLECRVILARAILQSGDANTAVPMFRQAVADLSAVLGETHPVTLEAMSGFAWALRDAGQPEEAIRISESILASWESQPEATLNTLKALEDLSWTYKDVGKLDAAIELSRRVVPQLKAQVGAEHPSTLIAMHHQAALLAMNGMIQEAIEVNEAARTGRATIFGPKHPETLWTMHTLSEYYSSAGRHVEAIALARETLAARSEVLAASHPHIMSSRLVLSLCLAAGGDRPAAITELQGMDAELKDSDPGSPRHIMVLETLAELLDQQGESSESVRAALERLKSPG